MLIKKLSMFFFLLGSLLALFGGVFELNNEHYFFLISLIIFTGLFIGFFNISKEQEKMFLLSSLVFIFILILFKMFLLDHGLIFSKISDFFLNFIFLISSAAFVVCIKVILRTASESEFEISKNNLNFSNDKKSFEYLWNYVVFISVAFIFIIFVLNQFYSHNLTDNFKIILGALDFFIWIIFLVDLFFIYTKAGNFKLFLKTGWLDIIAAFPPLHLLGTDFIIFRAIKLIRVARIIRVMRATSKIAKLPNPKIIKFFSKESGFNQFVEKKEIKSKNNKTKKKVKKTKKK
jgi:hypothetical protein